MKAVQHHIYVDSMNLFFCEGQTGEVTQASLEEAGDVEQQWHDDRGMYEEASDDINNCRLRPAKVLEARMAEMEFFRKMNESLCQGLDPKVQRSHREASGQSQVA